MTATSVFVSGATGFIAQHIVKQLIEKGYKVVGTVRSTEKGDRLKKNLGSDNFEYEIVKDIAEPNAFDEALKKHPEVTVFLHTASPFHFNTNDVEKDLLIPAIQGTKNALTSIKKYAPQIKKVVITSSFAAVSPPDKLGLNDLPPLNEDSWNPTTYELALTNPIFAYRGSKTFAEKAAWEFIESEKPNFTLNTVNPTYVFGPQAFASEVSDTLNTSSEALNKFLKLKPDDEVPVSYGGFADVRDVARTHIFAFEEDISGYRFLLATSRFTSQDVLDILNANFPQLKGKIPVGTPGSGKDIVSQLRAIDNSQTIAKIGKCIDLEKSVVDSIQQILEVRKL